jgi:hypothetical protein
MMATGGHDLQRAPSLFRFCLQDLLLPTLHDVLEVPGMLRS